MYVFISTIAHTHTHHHSQPHTHRHARTRTPTITHTHANFFTAFCFSKVAYQKGFHLCAEITTLLIYNYFMGMSTKNRQILHIWWCGVHTSSAGRGGMLNLGLVKKAIFSLNVCTGRGSLWLWPLICKTSFEAFLNLLSAASSCLCSCLVCFDCLWASRSRFLKRSSRRAQCGRSAGPRGPCMGSSSLSLSSLRAASSSVSCLCRVRQAWRSSSRSREVRVGCSARDERWDCCL